ncbi:MAG: universal stress protein, partial [Gammaproteobacteria bacterium]
SRDVVDQAISVARQLRAATLYIIKVSEDEPDDNIVEMDSWVSEKALDIYRQGSAARVRQDIEAHVSAWRVEHPEVDLQPLVIEARALTGEPAPRLLAEAEALSVDLIVIGSRGHSALEEMFLGSVAHTVSMKSRVPVLLVPVHIA